MSFLIELLLELFGEVLLQVGLQAMAEAGLYTLRKPGEHAEPSRWMLVVGHGLLGILVGGISVLAFPHSMMHSLAGRIVSLVLTPVAAGLAMALIGAWRQRRGQQTLAMDRFAYGYFFALVVALVRFAWAA